MGDRLSRGLAMLRLCAVLLAVLALSCNDKPAPAPGASSAAPAAPSLDLAAVVRRISLRFRPEGGAWRGGQSTYTVRAGAEGLRFTPRAAGQEAKQGAELSLGPAVIARGGAPARAGGGAIVEREGGLDIDRGPAAERVENTEAGVEQSFRFAQRPAGAGALTVRIPVSGQRYTGATEGGLHFKDDASGLGARYGAATWVDARGARTRLALAYEDGAVVITVPAPLVDESAYPAVLDPTVGPEIDTDTPIYGNSGGQTAQAVAYGGGQFLVVYSDGALWASRVTAAGAILDTYGISISTVAVNISGVSAAYDGTNFLVAWSDYRTGSNYDIYGARVSAAGSVLDPQGVPLISTAPAQARNRLALSYGGGRYLLAFIEGNGVYGASITTSATPGYPNPLSTSLTSPSAIAAAFNGTNHLVAFNAKLSTDQVIYGRRVDAFGSGLASPFAIVAHNASNSGAAIGVASNGTDWMVAYKSGQIDVRVARVTASGTSLDVGTDGVIVNSTANVNISAVRAVWDGTYYGVFWDSSNALAGLKVSTSAMAVSSIATSTTGITGPIAAFDPVNKNYFVAWSTYYAGGSYTNTGDTGATRINVSTGVLGTLTISRGANQQTGAAVAYNGQSWLVVWTDARSTSYNRIYGVRIDPSGTVLDPNGIAISSGSNEAGGPVVASNGTDWLVGWLSGTYVASGNYSLVAARVSAAGVVLDTTPIALGSGSSQSIASDGSAYVVVSTYHDTTLSQYNMFARRVSAAGAVLDTTPIALGTGYFHSVAYNGASWLVASTPIINGGVTGRRITSAGALLDASPFTIMSGASSPSVTALGATWLVGWYKSGSAYVSRVDTSATILDPAGITVTGAPFKPGFSKVASDGTNFWLVWEDQANYGNPDIYGARVSPAGVLLDTTPIAIANGPSPERLPSAAAGPAGAMLVAYHRWAYSPSMDAQRVHARIVTGTGGGGSICTTASDCTTGFCVDGVCCNTSCTGLCQACSAAKKGGGADGVCGPITAGTDPDSECTDQGAASCGTDGTCDGMGACRIYTAGTSCGAAVCQGTVVKTQVCNGTGTCGLGSGGTDCAPYACSAGACKTTCATGADCASGYTCSQGACVVPAGDGGPCSVGSDCASGFCADGVCCNSACTGLCQACSTAKKGGGANGVCGPIAAGTDPDNECAQQAASTCGTDGACNGAGACELWAAGTSCGATVCQGTVVKAQICDGSGTCGLASGGTDCAPYACSGGACLTTCATAADCAAGFVCSQGACTLPLGNGAACTSGAECQSGVCADGVCCATACNGLCQACSAAKKGSGADGVCGPITAGTDPDNECAQQAASTCGQDGACNGAGACELWAAGTSCGSPVCQGNVVKAQACNGTGTCGLAAGGSDCAPYACSAGACKTTCAANTDCAAGYVCSQGACVAPLANGSACVSGTECQSGVCADGVCCATTCNGLCQACSAAKKGNGTDGTCGPITAGTDPDNECGQQATSTCGTDGFCNGAGACELWAAGTSCGSPVCQGTVVKTQTCNGSGTCGLAAGGSDCAPYACSAGACKASCAGNGDCAPGYTCTASACVVPAGNGGPCTVGSDCASGFCADGVCCNSACNGLCQACSAAKKGGGSDGACGPILAGTDPDNECAQQATSTCGTDGACNGAGACELWAAGTSCGAPICQGTVVKTQTCNGTGTCGLASGGSDCAPYACSAGACKTTCAANGDCAAGFVCSQGACVPPLGNGTACQSGAECGSGFCVDGVCCNTACTGLCAACSVAKKGGGASGVCGPILAGTDPDDECAQQPASGCGQNGSCDGAGACQLWAQGTSCGASTCQGNVVTGHVCNGTGACVVLAGGQDCAPYVCGAGACKNPCADAGDCVAGYFCNAGTCTLLGGNGSPCTTAAGCQSGACVDGVCCDTPCNGPCQACSAAAKGQGIDGACGAVAAGADPHDDCAADAPSSCGQDGTCDGSGACAFFAMGTTCAPGSCTGATATADAHCDGHGTCLPGATTTCDPAYVCAGNACAASCTDDTACAAGYHCDGATCAMDLPDGGTGGTGGVATGGAGGTATGGSGTGGTATGGAGGTAMGGAGGKGGAAHGGEGGAATGEGGGGGKTPGEKGGCGCRMAGDTQAPGAAVAWLLLAVAGLRRRRGQAGGRGTGPATHARGRAGAADSAGAV
jgi:hypothetical protein